MWLLKISVQGRMRMMVGKMWGSCYVPGSGKLYGRFLGSRASVAHRRVYFVPHAELSSAAVFSSPLRRPWSAAGSPWQRPCRDSCVGRQKGDPRWQWAMSTRRKSCEGKWPRVTPRERCPASPEEGSSSRSHDFASSCRGNKEQQSWVGQTLFSLLLKPDYLQTPWLTRCPSSSSATVGSKVKPRFVSIDFCVTSSVKICQQLPCGCHGIGCWEFRVGLRGQSP